MSGTAALGVCRWRLECAEPAVTTVHHSRLGGYPACDADAADHEAWRARQDDGTVRLTGDPEPDPECFCPTTPRVRAPYCPEHGTPEERGIEP